MNLSDINWKRALLFILTFIGVVISLRILIFTLTPFFLGLVMAVMIDKPVNFMARRLPRNLAVFIMLIIVVSIFLLITFFIITNSIYELIYLSRYLPRYRDQIMEFIDDTLTLQQDFFERMPVVISDILENNLNAIYSRGNALLTNFVERIVNLTFNIPGLIILFLFTIITTFFLSKDKEKILYYIKKKSSFFERNQAKIISDIFSYLKVQLLIMTNTTILTGFTFYFLGYPYAILLALFSGVLDIIPVVGPGGVLWPMIAYNIFARPRDAVIFFILYLILMSSRPILESKILAKDIGVHPIILLLGVYIGLITLGFQGIILAPISIIFYKAILNTGLEL